MGCSITNVLGSMRTPDKLPKGSLLSFRGMFRENEKLELAMKRMANEGFFRDD